MTCPHCADLLRELDAVAPLWSTQHAFTLPVVVVSEANLRSHHHAKATRARRQREAVSAHLAPAAGYLRSLAANHPRLRVTLIRLGERALDDDNLAGAFKACRDAIATVLGVDDGPRGPVTWAYAQEPHRRHRLTPGIRIEIATPAPRSNP